MRSSHGALPSRAKQCAMVHCMLRMLFRTWVRDSHPSLQAPLLVLPGIPSPLKLSRASPVHPQQHI